MTSDETLTDFIERITTMAGEDFEKAGLEEVALVTHLADAIAFELDEWGGADLTHPDVQRLVWLTLTTVLSGVSTLLGGCTDMFHMSVHNAEIRYLLPNAVAKVFRDLEE